MTVTIGLYECAHDHQRLHHNRTNESHGSHQAVVDGLNNQFWAAFPCLYAGCYRLLRTSPTIESAYKDRGLYYIWQFHYLGTRVWLGFIGPDLS